jgi:hypothetical protein
MIDKNADVGKVLMARLQERMKGPRAFALGYNLGLFWHAYRFVQCSWGD